MDRMKTEKVEENNIMKEMYERDIKNLQRIHKESMDEMLFVGRIIIGIVVVTSIFVCGLFTVIHKC